MLGLGSPGPATSRACSGFRLPRSFLGLGEWLENGSVGQLRPGQGDWSEA